MSAVMGAKPHHQPPDVNRTGENVAAAGAIPSAKLLPTNFPVKEGRKVISVSMPPSLAAALRAKAKEWNWNISKVVRQMLLQGMDRTSTLVNRPNPHRTYFELLSELAAKLEYANSQCDATQRVNQIVKELRLEVEKEKGKEANADH